MGRESGGTFDAGIQFALERMLVSPSFQLRVYRDPEGAAPGETYPLSDLELASRLSFFLWSSIPDDTLLGLAERGELSDLQVFEGQIRRMAGGCASDRYSCERLRGPVVEFATCRYDHGG